MARETYGGRVKYFGREGKELTMVEQGACDDLLCGEQLIGLKCNEQAPYDWSVVW